MSLKQSSKRQKRSSEFSDDEEGGEELAVDKDIFPEPEPLPAISSYWKFSYDRSKDKMALREWTSTKILQPLDLADELPMHRIFGLDGIKDTLLSRICVPLAVPQLFDIGSNPETGVPVQKIFFFFGKHGSGKRTVVRSFCKESGITLCEANGPAFDPLKELDGLYAKATANTPSIVLFNDCNQVFMQGGPGAAPLASKLEEVSRSPVWTIFRSEFLPENILDNLILGKIGSSVWAEVPSPINRERIWITAMKRYSHSIAITSKDMGVLCDASINCTAGNIVRFVQDCYSNKVAQMGVAVVTYDKDHAVFTLNMADIKLIETASGGRRITARPIDQENVEYYRRPVKADNPNFNPNNRRADVQYQ